MRNYQEKTKDLAESVLPSTRPKTARYNKNSLKRRTRRINNINLNSLKNYDNVIDFEGHFYDSNGVVPTTGFENHISVIVGERRDKDKLSIVNWAENYRNKKLGHLPDAEAFEHFRNLLPDTLQGRHALGHIKSAIDPYGDSNRYGYISQYLVEYKPGFWRYKNEVDRRREREAEADRMRFIRLEKLYKIATTQDFESFNDQLKREHISNHATGLHSRGTYRVFTCEFCTPTPRLLLGIGDIKPWFEYATKACSRHGYFRTLDKFVLRGERR